MSSDKKKGDYNEYIIVRLWYKPEPQIEIHSQNNVQFVAPDFLSNKHISNERFCIGYDVGGKYVPCGKRIEKGYQCEECKAKDLFLPCARCDGSKCINERAWGWCDQEFIVYLAYFGGRVIKVGVAAKERSYERLLEQGAVAYSIYDEVENGLIARKIENSLKGKYVDKVNYLKKMELYRKIELDWFEERVGSIEIVKENLEKAKLLENKTEIKKPQYIPRVTGTIGQIVITENGFFPFSKIRGRKIVKKQSLTDFLQ